MAKTLDKIEVSLTNVDPIKSLLHLLGENIDSLPTNVKDAVIAVSEKTGAGEVIWSDIINKYGLKKSSSFSVLVDGCNHETVSGFNDILRTVDYFDKEAMEIKTIKPESFLIKAESGEVIKEW